MMRACLIAAIPLFTLQASVVRAQMSNVESQTTPVAYLTTVIDSLANVHEAIGAVNAQKNDDFLAKMVALKNGRIEIRAAILRLEPYRKAVDENVRFSSDSIATAFDWIDTSFGLQLEGYEKLDAAKSVDDLVGLRKGMSDATVAYQQATKILIDAATIAVASAIVADPDDKDRIALHMSETERIGLIKRLKDRFGPKLVTTNGDTGPMNAAKVMLKGLDQKWRLAP